METGQDLAGGDGGGNGHARAAIRCGAPMPRERGVEWMSAWVENGYCASTCLGAHPSRKSGIDPSQNRFGLLVNGLDGFGDRNAPPG
jgi:hypothetical protein